MLFGVLISTTVSQGQPDSRLSLLPFGIWGNGVSFGPDNSAHRDTSCIHWDSSYIQGEGKQTGRAVTRRASWGPGVQRTRDRNV